MPDVIGLPLDDARARLAAAAIEIRTMVETRPPKAVELAGELRVIRVRGDGPVDIIVTRERYVPSQAAP